MKIQPLGDRVLVQVLETEEITKGGIIIPDSAKEKKSEGKILALGNGEEIKKLGIKVGDVVLFSKYEGEDVKVDGKDCKILIATAKVKESHIIALVTK